MDLYSSVFSLIPWLNEQSVCLELADEEASHLSDPGRPGAGCQRAPMIPPHGRHRRGTGRSIEVAPVAELRKVLPEVQVSMF